jgi:general secretion pathway protein N
MARHRAPDRTAPDAATPARRPWWLIAVGLGAVLAFVAATLPARLLESRLTRAGLAAAGLSGTLWNGHARALSWQSVPVGDLRWSLAPLELLRGRIGGDFSLVRPDGTLDGKLGLSLGGTLHLRDVHADLPVEAISAFPVGMPRGWRGRIDANFESIVVEAGWPTRLEGTVDMEGLIAPPPRNASIGSYHVVMPDPKAVASEGTPLTAHVSDIEGPFSFDGRFTLDRDRNFLLDGTLAPRGDTPPELVRSIELLGPADSAGRRPVSVSGTL